MKRIKLQPAFVLHSKPFRDTSLLVDFLTLHHGRIRAVARSARGPKSRFKGTLRPFMPLLISLSGNNELVTLSGMELTVSCYELEGKHLLSGFYLNELLIRLLQFNDSHSDIYAAYEKALIHLHQKAQPETVLRLFEKTLLLGLGYGIQLNHEANTQGPIEPEAQYEFNPQIGFTRQVYHSFVSPSYVFNGKDLLAFHAEQLEDPESLKAAKRLMRLALAPLLGDQPLKSKELFLT